MFARVLNALITYHVKCLDLSSQVEFSDRQLCGVDRFISFDVEVRDAQEQERVIFPSLVVQNSCQPVNHIVEVSSLSFLLLVLTLCVQCSSQFDCVDNAARLLGSLVELLSFRLAEALGGMNFRLNQKKL